MHVKCISAAREGHPLQGEETLTRSMRRAPDKTGAPDIRLGLFSASFIERSSPAAVFPQVFSQRPYTVALIKITSHVYIVSCN